MLDALEGHCAARRARTLWLEVRTGNARAQAIYRRYGFVEVGVRKGYYPAPQSRREDALVMSLDIAARRGLVHALD
jgi:ribosomal-protein-alanine N-acetyltransferase